MASFQILASETGEMGTLRRLCAGAMAGVTSVGMQTTSQPTSDR